PLRERQIGRYPSRGSARSAPPLSGQLASRRVVDSGSRITAATKVPRSPPRSGREGTGSPPQPSQGGHMRFLHQTPRRVLLALGFLPAFLFALACGDSNAPTAPGGGGGGLGMTAMVNGTGIMGASETRGLAPKSGPVGVAGSPRFSSEPQDLPARGRFSVAAGVMNRFTFSIRGDRAEVAPGGHSG